MYTQSCWVILQHIGSCRREIQHTCVEHLLHTLGCLCFPTATKQGHSGEFRQVKAWLLSANRDGGVSGKCSTNYYCNSSLIICSPFWKDGPATRHKLHEILTNQEKCNQLKAEPAVTIDLGEHFVKSTYRLEGDGPLVLEWYDVISSLMPLFAFNITLMCRQFLASLHLPLSHYSNIGSSMLRPVSSQVSSTSRTSSDESQCPLAAFKAAIFFSPFRLHEIEPAAADLDLLNVFPFINSAILESLKAELPTNLAKAADVNPRFYAIEWWT